MIALGFLRTRHKVVCAWPLSSFACQSLGLFIFNFECRLDAQLQLLLELRLIKALSDGGSFAFFGSHAHLKSCWKDRAALRKVLGFVEREFLWLLGNINGPA
jgi:hypothetical protein